MATLKKKDGTSRQYALTAGAAERLQDHVGCKLFSVMDEGGAGFLQGFYLNPMNAVKVVKFCFQMEDEEVDQYDMDDIYDFVENLIIDFFPKRVRATVRKLLTLIQEGMANPDLLDPSLLTSPETP